MNYYRDNIIKLIEGELTSKQKELIQNEISTNSMVKEEYKLQMDIDSYMRAKFSNENAKIETDSVNLDQDVSNLIKEHFEESPDFEILDFLSHSNLDNSKIVKKELNSFLARVDSGEIKKYKSRSVCWRYKWDWHRNYIKNF